LQAIRPGVDLDGAWRAVDALDDDLDGRLDFAFSSTLGFLTSCPTNVGTGMRASVQAHLPAVVLNKDLERLIEDLRSKRLAIRGFYGEGSAAFGNFFQVSNGTTLGVREAEILERLDAAARELADWEERARRPSCRGHGACSRTRSGVPSGSCGTRGSSVAPRLSTMPRCCGWG